MSKTIKIDLSEDRLLAMAADCVDQHNLIGALRMLNKNGAINGNSAMAYMLYAEIFDDMQLYEKSVNNWFRFIDSTEEDLADAYEGLALCYLNMGQENYAAFYYNKLLMETDQELTSENRQEIVNAFLTADKNPLKIAYPPRFADFTGEIDNGINFLRDNDYENAIREFSKVEEGNEKHKTARNYIAMCNIICDKCEEAEQECLAILEKYPDDVQALTTLAAVKTQQKKSEESKALANKLLSLNASNIDDVYKIATVCCENKMHEEAYGLFCKLEEELSYDISVLYFKAVSAYNCGKRGKCLDAFEKLLTIYPDAVTAKYYYHEVKSAKEGEDYKQNPLSYFYRMPQEQREANLKLLSAFAKLSDKAAKKLASELDISDCIKWCFDDDLKGGELELLGAACAVKGRLDELVADILLDTDVSDSVKMDVLGALAERNEDNVFGVVICNIFSSVTILSLDIGRLKRKYFVKAYSMLLSRFAILNDNYVYLLNTAAVKLYGKLADSNLLGGCKDINTLSAVIFKMSGIHERALDDDEGIISFFGADRNKYAVYTGV